MRGRGGWVGAGRIRNVQRFRGGFVFKADRLLYHSTLYCRVPQFARVDATQAEGAEQAASEIQRLEAKVVVHTPTEFCPI